MFEFGLLYILEKLRKKSLDVLDIVSIVNHIVGENTLDNIEYSYADYNSDLYVEVLDIVGMVNSILSE